ncbi:amino acid ABC transporter permease [Thermoflavimicrobium dichotomicum]|uniref:Putative glutamine transport system permease protein n=1 Tax=Thermoflavimicrobium dichotomicum TaxID=46223 RepID=A0A1I3JHA2_9BACL|nr:amino acid ABC transporter permease [Thermoflavimicrobium dichotomicum]SFI59627.1 putative glutamine transport system permease protein [Thermoflavimicrobium dichotomicum]
MDFSSVFDPTHWSALLSGLQVTLSVAFSAIALSFVFGIILGVLRYTRIPVVSHIATLYIEIIRNLPLLLIIFFGYFAFKDWGIQIPITLSVIISMTVFTSALVAEIVRSGLNSVDKGQIEAARSQGFTYIQTLWYIIMPQALKKMIPPMVSQFVSLLKDTSLAVAISLPELTHAAQIIYNSKYNATIPLLILVAMIYFVINYTLSLISRYLERRLAG